MWGAAKDQELAVDGPYSVCRNPLYLGTFLLTLSIAFFIHSLMFAIGLLIATPLYLWVTVPWEEARLREKFGERYDAYRARCQSSFLLSRHFSPRPRFR